MLLAGEMRNFLQRPNFHLNCFVLDVVNDTTKPPNQSHHSPCASKKGIGLASLSIGPKAAKCQFVSERGTHRSKLRTRLREPHPHHTGSRRFGCRCVSARSKEDVSHELASSPGLIHHHSQLACNRLHPTPTRTGQAAATVRSGTLAPKAQFPPCRLHRNPTNTYTRPWRLYRT